MKVTVTTAVAILVLCLGHMSSQEGKKVQAKNDQERFGLSSIKNLYELMFSYFAIFSRLNKGTD